jgi:putative intracellular protease/amidase
MTIPIGSETQPVKWPLHFDARVETSKYVAAKERSCVRLTSLLFFMISFSPAWGDLPETKRILIVVSNVVDMGDAEAHDARNNLWEVAPPYHVFLAHDYEVDFVSPKGGNVEFSMDPIGISSYTIKYEGFMDRAKHSLTPGDVAPGDYDAAFIGGGYGPLFDVASDRELLSLIAEIYQNGGVVGGCGHGPGAFANVILSDGEYMVAGKKVAGFPSSTEITKAWAGQGALLPFLVEDQLRKNGAVIVNKENIADKNDVIVDQRIVSSMFLPSAALVAKEMIRLLEGS